MPRAELTAILQCLNDLTQCPNIVEIILYSGCKMAVDSSAKGKVYAQRTTCGATWAVIWGVLEELEEKRTIVSILKVKAHTDDDQLADHRAGRHRRASPRRLCPCMEWHPERPQ